MLRLLLRLHVDLPCPPDMMAEERELLAVLAVMSLAGLAPAALHNAVAGAECGAVSSTVPSVVPGASCTEYELID